MAFAHPLKFVKLRKKANITHARYTYNLARKTEDKRIYNLATKENKILVVQDNDFKLYAKYKGAGVLIIPSYLSNKQIDNLLTDFISGKNPDDFLGKAIKI